MASDTLPTVLLLDARTARFKDWAGALIDQLSAYNIPLSPDEGSWSSWAARFAEVPEAVATGVPYPQGFRSWRTWALSVAAVMG